MKGIKDMKTKPLKEEKEILESFEKGEWTRVENLSERKKALAERKAGNPRTGTAAAGKAAPGKPKKK